MGVLDGRVAIITEPAEVIAGAGARVVVADISDPAGQQTARGIVSVGGDATFVHADVSRSDEVAALVQAAVSAYGRLDCAVNNAATAPDSHRIADLDEAEFDRIIAVDLKSVALCLKYEIRQMLSQGEGGSIVNIGSVNSSRPQPTSAGYTAAKHGVLGLTKVASVEYAGEGIRVNAVCPGAVDTPMLRTRLAASGRDEHEHAARLSLFGRFGRPDEVAQASLWLCSDQSSFVTGHALAVDGGYLSR